MIAPSYPRTSSLFLFPPCPLPVCKPYESCHGRCVTTSSIDHVLFLPSDSFNTRSLSRISIEIIPDSPPVLFPSPAGPLLVSEPNIPSFNVPLQHLKAILS